ncbi:hypothetical protein [Streptomyces cyaneogriseus]|uniref:hypothetical protein n=1 Tax=Streptomyces cyaneogriseus TaxID=68192 RepID=UPI000AA3A540|nr:hypothetical protein [Streptomyces cyaneogriseus]
MERGQAPWPGAAARGAGRRGGRASRLTLALLATALTAACAAPGAPGGPATASPRRTGTPAPASPALSDRELCARLVSHWARETLEGDTYGDYQSMGLSGGQYEILLAIVAAARDTGRRQGARAAHELIDREARERCAARYGDDGPGGSPRR